MLPAGTLNVVTGLPAEIGDRLTTHPDVGKIGFTGSIKSAQHIMAKAAGSIKGVTLELGGNDPAIVLADADLSEETVKKMVGGIFQCSGQVCMAIKRIYVSGEIRDQSSIRSSALLIALSSATGSKRASRWAPCIRKPVSSAPPVF